MTVKKHQIESKGKGGKRRGRRESKQSVSGKPRESAEPEPSSQFTRTMGTMGRSELHVQVQKTTSKWGEPVWGLFLIISMHPYFRTFVFAGLELHHPHFTNHLTVYCKLFSNKTDFLFIFLDIFLKIL